MSVQSITLQGCVSRSFWWHNIVAETAKTTSLLQDVASQTTTFKNIHRLNSRPAHVRRGHEVLPRYLCDGRVYFLRLVFLLVWNKVKLYQGRFCNSRYEAVVYDWAFSDIFAPTSIRCSRRANNAHCLFPLCALFLSCFKRKLANSSQMKYCIDIYFCFLATSFPVLLSVYCAK